MTKKQQRLRRSRQTRLRIVQQGTARLAVHRSNQHLYAAIFSDDGCRVLASASTSEKEVREQMANADNTEAKDGKNAKNGKNANVAAASIIGKRIAEKAKAAGIDKVAFDRSGFAYHGRVKALAEAAREAGLQF